MKLLFDKSVRERTSEEKEVIKDILHRFQNAVSKDENAGRTTLNEHSVDTGDAKLIQQRPRRVPLALSDEERKAVQQMKEQGVIRESNSPWSSPIVLVRKKSGKIRPCIDYWKVNSVNKLMPSLFQGYFLDASEAKLFSTFDLTS